MRHEVERRKAALARDEDPLDDLPIAVLILVDGELVRINDGWTSLTGLGWRDSIGDQWLRGIHEDDHAAAVQLIAHREDEGVRVGELRVRALDHRGTELWVHARSRFVGEDPGACVITLTEIDARKAHELRLVHLATHDPATGLVNRDRFVALLQSLLDQSLADQPLDEPHVAVLFVDLDRFKEVNDRHGHAFGDIVLAMIAQRLESLVRPSDTVARLGGDEFAVLLPGVDLHADAARLADRVIAAVSAPLIFGERSVAVGASIGIALSGAGLTGEALVELADQAMYRAKAAGGSRWTFAETGAIDDGNSAVPGSVTSLDEPLEEMVHHVQVALAATETEVLTVVGRLEDTDAAAAETVRDLFEQLWSVVAEVSVPRRGASCVGPATDMSL